MAELEELYEKIDYVSIHTFLEGYTVFAATQWPQDDFVPELEFTVESKKQAIKLCDALLGAEIDLVQMKIMIDNLIKYRNKEYSKITKLSEHETD